MCLKSDRLSSPVGTLPGKALIVGFQTASYKPKHVYLFLQFRGAISPSLCLLSPRFFALINFKGLSAYFFGTEAIVWELWGGDAFLGKAGFKLRLLFYFAFFFSFELCLLHY